MGREVLPRKILGADVPAHGGAIRMHSALRLNVEDAGGGVGTMARNMTLKVVVSSVALLSSLRAPGCFTSIYLCTANLKGTQKSP